MLRVHHNISDSNRSHHNRSHLTHFTRLHQGLRHRHDSTNIEDADNVIRPLVDYQPSCPIMLIAQRRTPVNQGFGARVTFLMWAADVAIKLGAVLVLDDRYFSSGHMHQFHYGNDIRWAWPLFPFQNHSSAARHLPAGMIDRTKSTVTVEKLMNTWECNSMYKLQPGIVFSCGPTVRWCYDRFPGALERSLTATSAANTATPLLRTIWERWALNASGPALAVWHIRTGDITLPLRPAAAKLIKERIVRAFPRRGVRHALVTYQKSDLVKSFPWLAKELGTTEIYDEKVLNDPKAFEMILSAQVLVSTGSSFPHIPAGLAQPGRQIHFYMPPKGVSELRQDGGCCIPDTCHCELPQDGLTPREKNVKLTCQRNTTLFAHNGGGVSAPNDPPLSFWADRFRFLTRSHNLWAGSFMRKNTIPVACNGEIFPEYRYKLEEMGKGIDSESGFASPYIATLAYEGWMR